MVIAIYDNENVIDRYTVFFNELDGIFSDNTKYYKCLSMSENPLSGVYHFGSGILGKHNGKPISFEELSIECKNFIESFWFIKKER
jgi:hypothetical protein